jgi:hypothetical protein
MATMNPTAVRKTVDALTNHEILTSIIKKSEQIEHEDFTIELAGAILDNPEAGKLVDWLADGKDVTECIASALASLITAARMPLTKEKPAKEAAKKFEPPLAKVLLFNLEGKAVEDVMSPDRAYMAQYFKASVLRYFPEKEVSDLARCYRMDEAEGVSHECEKYSRLEPLYVAEECSATKGNPDNPTPPAA